jgi:hypothetical protein
MELIPKSKDGTHTKGDTELVEQEKEEYKLVGEYSRTRGLGLFYYDPRKNIVAEQEIKYGNTIHLVPKDGELIPVDYEQEKATVDTRCIYFESLNLEKAKKRVKRWKQGRVKELCNLKPPKNGTIELF